MKSVFYCWPKKVLSFQPKPCEGIFGTGWEGSLFPEDVQGGCMRLLACFQLEGWPPHRVGWEGGGGFCTFSRLANHRPQGVYGGWGDHLWYIAIPLELRYWGSGTELGNRRFLLRGNTLFFSTLKNPLGFNCKKSKIVSKKLSKKTVYKETRVGTVSVGGAGARNPSKHIFFGPAFFKWCAFQLP